MNEENSKPINLLDHLLGMHVVDCSIDNDTLLLKFDRASFAFFCEYEILPESTCLTELIGATLDRIADNTKLMSFGFESGLAINFSWEEARTVEAFAGSIDVGNGQTLWITEQVHTGGCATSGLGYKNN
ncbi:MAG: hypothetical protein IPI39_00705 [Candidatus Obscuribacter sp.]|nr:hypothetical protein [Candidatus Obscuribacter sp.]